MTTLLLADHDTDATSRALTAALQLGGEVHVLHGGANELAEPIGYLLMSLDGYDAIVAPATSSGKNILPRIAALNDVMQISDIIEVVSPDTFRRPIYAGNAIETVQSTDTKKVITVRASAFPPTTGGARACTASREPARRRCSRRRSALPPPSIRP